MQFDLSFERNEVYECGAALLTVLANPKENDGARSLELYLSLCGGALWLMHSLNPEDEAPTTVKPKYVFRDRKINDRHVRFVARRLSERMVARRMAIAFFQQAELGRLPSLPKEVQRLSVNQMANFVLEDAGQADASNVERRIWAPSRPVIHLAAAAAIVGQQLHKGDYPLALESLLLHRWLIEAIVNLAVELEALIAKDPKFPVRQEQLIRFRLG
jgi:hypothetical protein